MKALLKSILLLTVLAGTMHTAFAAAVTTPTSGNKVSEEVCIPGVGCFDPNDSGEHP